MTEHEVQIIIDWAKSIRSEAEALSFDSYDDSKYNKEACEAVLLKYLDFEERSPLMPSLYFAYGDIAEAYLNVQDFGNALKYISAILILTEKEKDFEGINKAYKLLINVSAATLNFKIAHKYASIIDEQYDSEKGVLVVLFEELAKNENIVPAYKFPKNILTIRKPKTFKYLIEPFSEQTNEETILRLFLYKSGNFSRSEAKKALKTAKQFLQKSE